MIETGLRDPVELLARTAALMYGGTLLGDPPPFLKERRERMTNLHVGDLVVELTTCRRQPFDPSCIGWLEDVREEPVMSTEEWIADGGDLPVPTDTYWYLRTLSGEPARWWNCAFVSIPDGPEDEWLQRRNGKAFRGGF